MQFQDVPSSPLPMTITIWGHQIGGQNVVALRISTPVGPMLYWLTPDDAIQVSKQLRQHGKAGKVGLALPEGVNLGGDDEEEDVDLTLPPPDLDAARAMGEKQAAELLAEQRRAAQGPEITET